MYGAGRITDQQRGLKQNQRPLASRDGSFVQPPSCSVDSFEGLPRNAGECHSMAIGCDGRRSWIPVETGRQSSRLMGTGTLFAANADPACVSMFLKIGNQRSGQSASRVWRRRRIISLVYLHGASVPYIR
jgi:hypothetical protein